MYTYDVTPMYFQSGSPLRAGPSVSLGVDLRLNYGGPLDVGFIRPSTIAWDNPSHERPDVGRGRELLRRFLDEAHADPDSTLRVVASQLDDDALLKRFAAFGPRLSLILTRSVTATKTDHSSVVRTLTQAKCRVIDLSRAKQPLASDVHFMVRCRGGKAVGVFAGSLLFTRRALSGQFHFVVHCRDLQVARLYDEKFLGWETQTKPRSLDWIPVRLDNGVSIELLFTPAKRGDILVSGEVEQAESSAMFVLDTPASKDLDHWLTGPGKSGLLVSGLVRDRDQQVVYWNRHKTRVAATPEARAVTRSMEGRNGGQYVAIDFNSSSPLVLAAISDFSTSRPIVGNVLRIRDRAISTMFAVEAFAQSDDAMLRYLA
jgi:hypothetical protein